MCIRDRASHCYSCLLPWSYPETQNQICSWLYVIGHYKKDCRRLPSIFRNLKAVCRSAVLSATVTYRVLLVCFSHCGSVLFCRLLLIAGSCSLCKWMYPMYFSEFHTFFADFSMCLFVALSLILFADHNNWSGPLVDVQWYWSSTKVHVQCHTV